MVRTLRKLVTLKPYGNNLLDGVAETWIVLAALNIVSIAFCDAVAWAYFGYTTATGRAAWVTAAIAAAVTFMLVASVDAMFVMHDRARPRRDTKAREGEEVTGKSFFRRIHRDHVAIAARIVLVVLTFTVTAPFLTQLFFARDIEASIKRQNEQTVAATRQKIEGSLDSQTAAVRSQLAERQRDLEREIAGSGSSGRYGDGPTAAAIRRDITLLGRRVASMEKARQSELETFDRAVATPEVLANRYGVDLVRQGPETRARAIAQLEQSPSFRATNRSIKAFLVFMFLGLVCLKLFQPESVRIYYNARLQAAWQRLKGGAFDHRLDPREQPDAGGMSPIRFADWYENDQLVRDETERLRDQTASAIERLRAQEDALQLLGETLRADITRMSGDLSATAETSEDIERQLLTTQQELAALQRKIAEEQQALDDFRYDFADDLPLRDQQLLISSRHKTVRNLAEHRSAAAALNVSMQRLTYRLEAVRKYENELRESLASAGTEAAALTRALQQARQKRAADIAAL